MNEAARPVPVTAAVLEVLEGDAPLLVQAYYRFEPRDYGRSRQVLFAGRRFDELPDNHPDRFTAHDLLAVSLLDVRLDAHAVHQLLERDEASALLHHLPATTPLWEAGDRDLDQDSAAWALWNALEEIPGVGRTRASKLLARKRPHLMPILDSVIIDSLQLEAPNRWLLLRDVLTSEVRGEIDRLGSAAREQGACAPSTLRLLDVVTWMKKSKSESAAAVREWSRGQGEPDGCVV